MYLWSSFPSERGRDRGRDRERGRASERERESERDKHKASELEGAIWSRCRARVREKM